MTRRHCELTDADKRVIFAMYLRPERHTLGDIRARFDIDSATCHLVYDEAEAMVRSLRRRDPGRRLLS